MLYKHLYWIATPKKVPTPNQQHLTSTLETSIIQDLIDQATTVAPTPDEPSTQICRVTFSPLYLPAAEPGAHCPY